MKNMLIIAIIGLFVIVSIAFQSTSRSIDTYSLSSPQLRSDTLWIAPEEANALVNPIEVDEDNMMEAKALYKKHCRSCHGKLGDGKGSGAADLSTEPTDLRTPDFQSQTDGSMFWKILEGKDEMKSYKKKMSEEDVWLTVIYVRTLATEE